MMHRFQPIPAAFVNSNPFINQLNFKTMLGSKLDIMKTGWINLVFANRNQAYGAYELRQNNERNTARALFIAISFFVLVLATPTIINIIKGYIPAADPKVIDFTNTVIPPPTTIAPQKVEPPRVAAARPHNNMRQFLPAVVKPDLLATDLPKDEDLQKVDVGPKTMSGDDKSPITVDEAPGTDKNGLPGVTEEDNSDEPFRAVEVEPAPPGGMEKFYAFLSSKIHYPEAAKENNTQGRVIVTFVVERDGSLTDIKTLRDPGNGLGEEAIRVLKLAPRWSPGVQNAKKVRVQFTIPINFNLNDQ